MTHGNRYSTEYGDYFLSFETPSFSPTEWGEECLFLYVQEGEGEIIIDGYKYPMTEGDIFIAPPFTMRSVQAKNFLVTDCAALNLRLLALNCDPKHDVSTMLPFVHEKTLPNAIKTRHEYYDEISAMILTLLNTADDKSLAQRITYEILSFFKKHGSVKTSAYSITEEKQRFAVQQAITYIKDSYATAVTVREAADATGYDEFYAMKLFKRYTGKSIIDYTNGCRIAAAKELLKSTKKQVSQIAEQVGYDNVSYFNRQFKKYLRVTPVEYRLLKN
ncbi:MAG: AraC family transcriptional regulator [Corallococcus sp.]|nr:AraC family transcriptional regulator [Bacillota bacterium]MCM1533437.1 AraC family transcriptional regulator [Corallococcus sp.]